MPEKSIEQVHKEYFQKWISIPGVEGAGIGLENDKPCILVFASVEPELIHDVIPSIIEGYPVIIKQTGKLNALDND